MNLAKEWEKMLISHCEHTKEDVKDVKRLIAEGTTAYSLFVNNKQEVVGSNEVRP